MLPSWPHVLQFFHGTRTVFLDDDSSSVSDSEVGAYRRTLTDEAAAQALRDVLAASGIEAAIARTDTGWQVTLVHAADGQKAEALLAANCGTIPYEITAEGTAP